MRTKALRFTSVSALLLGCFIIAILIGHNFSRHSSPIQTKQAIPDFFAKNFQIVQMNENGSPKNVLKSTYAEHYPKTEMIYLAAPSVSIHSSTGTLWKIAAEHGKTWGKHIDKVYLWENVIISRPNDENTQAPTLTTTEIYYYPPTKIAYTDKPITVTQPGGIVNSIGLQANFNTGIISLLSQARGHYVPKEPRRNI